MRPPKLPLVLLPLPLLAAGCLWTSTGTSGYGSADRAAAAEANVRAAIPALEAYYADHGSYAGATVAALRRYDRGVSGVRILRVTGTTYCLQSSFGGATAHKDGPAAAILRGRCP
jgi:hypothetical protein